MADLERTVSILFQGADGGIGSALDNISAGFGKLSLDGDSLSASLAGIGVKAVTGILALDAAVTSLAAGGMAYAIQQSGKFGGSFNEISTLISRPREELGGFKDDILEYAQTSAASIEEINGAIYKAISAGVAYDTVLNVLNTTEKLSVAGRANLSDTTMLVVQTLNAYGATTAEAGRCSDILFTAIKDGQVTLPQLNQGLGEVVAVASSAKIPFDTLAAAIAALTAYGVQAPEAITGMKDAIKEVLTPAAGAKAAFEELGISFGQSAINAIGFDGILKEIYDKTGGNIEKIHELIPNIRALPAVLKLGEDAGGLFAKTLKDMSDSAGATDLAFDKMKGGLKDATQEMTNNITVFAIEVGDKIVGTFKGTEKSIAELFKEVDFALNAGLFDGLFAVLNKLGLDFNKWLSDLAKSLPDALSMVDFKGLEDSILRVAKAVKELLGDFDPTDPAQVADAIVLVVDGLASLGNATAAIIPMLKVPIAMLVEAMRLFGDVNKDTWASVQGATAAFAGFLVEVIRGVASLADLVLKSDAFNYSIKTVSDIITIFFRSLQLGLEAGELGFLAITDALLTFSQSILEAVHGSIFEQFFGDVSTPLAKVKELRASVENEIIGLTDKINANAQQLSDFLGFTTKDAANKVSQAVKEGGDKTYEEWLAVVTNFKGAGIDLNAANVTKQAGEVATTIKTKIPDEKKIDVQLDVAEIKAQAEIVQKSIEWTAKVNIAEAESNAKIMVAAFASLGESAKAAGEAIGAGFKVLTELGKPGADSHFYEVVRLIEKEMSIQEKAIDAQISLAEAQQEYYMTKTKALNNPNGSALISVTAAGLEPEIEAFMFKILQKIQIRANEEQATFLLGLK